MKKINNESEFLDKMAREGLEAFKSHGDIDEVQQEIFQALEGSNTKVRTRNRKFLVYLLPAAAAMILLLIMINPFSSNAFSEYFPNPSFVLDQTNRNIHSQNDFTNKLSVAYNASDWKNVLNLFNDQPDQVSNNLNLIVYKGIAEMRSGQLEEAQKSLVMGTSTELGDVSTWFLAELYLKMDDLAQAKQTLILITKSTDHYKRDDAIRLLKELE